MVRAAEATGQQDLSGFQQRCLDNIAGGHKESQLWSETPEMPGNTRMSQGQMVVPSTEGRRETPPQGQKPPGGPSLQKTVLTLSSSPCTVLHPDSVLTTTDRLFPFH